MYLLEGNEMELVGRKGGGCVAVGRDQSSWKVCLNESDAYLWLRPVGKSLRKAAWCF